MLIVFGTVGIQESFAENNSQYNLLEKDTDDPPLKQSNLGIPIFEIQCKVNLVLIQKHDGSPACVTLQTKEKLIERGWADNPVKLNTTIKPIKTIPSDSALAKKITESNNQFTLDFYRQISKEKNENVFFSSPSISTAFSILYEGAKGDTAAEIQDVFGFPTDDNERQVGFMSFINMMNQKNNDENTVQMSNALWLANGFTPLPKYTDTAKTYYDSSIDTVNFATDEGRLEINDWVKSKTQNRIEELLVPGSTTSLTKMVITNTIYFKGAWEYPFDLENTYDGDFAVDSTKTVTAPMMTYEHKMNLNHTSTEQMQMLQMPYKGNSFSMLIILPHDAEDMPSVEDSITLDNLELWKSQFRDFRGTIHIPKFTLDTEYDLKETLPDMGITSVFGPADLSGITGYKGLFVSKAVHKAFVEVNEIGTEAATATAINTDESGGRLFKADHPFIFLIQDNMTNDILFIGKVMDPTK
ncbi:serpin family protein [Nitrosopumilus ureiphilus]|uniref:serpin family protein n=1 Tax=Nitrosopumilus ureiphilus TaxID=1470067 RepID=UPI0015CC7982|nr:serpin family protein [Nitrosopumilus ureiphilus]